MSTCRSDLDYAAFAGSEEDQRETSSEGERVLRPGLIVIARDEGRFAFLRPPLNRSPDIDPEPFTGNFRAFLDLVFRAGAG